MTEALEKYIGKQHWNTALENGLDNGFENCI
jgi:hypothetical protein